MTASSFAVNSLEGIWKNLATSLLFSFFLSLWLWDRNVESNPQWIVNSIRKLQKLPSSHFYLWENKSGRISKYQRSLYSANLCPQLLGRDSNATALCAKLLMFAWYLSYWMISGFLHPTSQHRLPPMRRESFRQWCQTTSWPFPLQAKRQCESRHSCCCHFCHP